MEEILAGLDVEVKESDFLSHDPETLVKNNLSIVWEPAKKVTIATENEEETIWTTAKTVEQL